ncbi:TniB family NTP-binding protein [Rhizobium laguerreae]|uniref:TniB family NTP-binding protein n=1 Tax=Rhizobium laguerreae TaxID=1076926 RepID=UPI0030008FF6
MDELSSGGERSHSRTALDPANQRIFDIMASVRGTYFKTKNDDELLVKLRRIERGIQDEREPGHALIIMGESGTGKSAIVEKTLKSLDTLQDYDDGYGNQMRPILYVVAPPGCTMTDLAIEILERLGYESTVIGRGASVYNKVRRSLQNYGVRLLVIDEFQHVLEAPKIKGPAYVANTMKNMLQDKSWPVHLALVGLPEIEAVIERDPAEQMERRTDPLVMVNPTFEDDGEYVEWIVKTLVEDRAGLRMSSDQPHEFVERLMHGARSRFGLIMHIIYYAIEDALEMGQDEVSTENWIEAYARLAKSRGTDDNVFAEPAWRSIIRPVNRDGSLGPVAPVKSPKKGRK